jgi:hypothetical protein
MRLDVIDEYAQCENPFHPSGHFYTPAMKKVKLV